jgi:CPA2 family monovalent cation:H+ antiporter-2
MGMLLNVAEVFKKPLEVIGLVLLVLTVKLAVIFLVGRIMQVPRRALWITALALCQVGEFAFILAQQGPRYGLINSHVMQMFLAVSVITMGISPFLIQAAPHLTEKILQLTRSAARQRRHKKKKETGEVVPMKDHLIIIGYGVNGRNVARAARKAGIPYLIIDYNPETYRRERKHHSHFIYGDAASAETLERASAAQARLAVVATHDPIATEMIVSAIRKHYRQIHIIVRARFMHETETLKKLGADEVISEEFETSVEIFARVMKHYLVPEDEIHAFIETIRSENYRMFRTGSWPQKSADTPFLSELEVTRLQLKADSLWQNRSLKEINLRKHHGITIIAVERNSTVISNPSADFILQAGDILIALGRPEDFKKITDYVVFMS